MKSSWRCSSAGSTRSPCRFRCGTAFALKSAPQWLLHPASCYCFLWWSWCYTARSSERRPRETSSSPEYRTIYLEHAPMHMGAAVGIKNLVKTYGDFTAVDKVSLDIKPGEFLTLLGSSGSGKTTTLMAVAGFTIPDSGSIT